MFHKTNYCPVPLVATQASIQPGGFLQSGIKFLTLPPRLPLTHLTRVMTLPYYRGQHTHHGEQSRNIPTWCPKHNLVMPLTHYRGQHTHQGEQKHSNLVSKAQHINAFNTLQMAAHSSGRVEQKHSNLVSKAQHINAFNTLQRAAHSPGRVETYQPGAQSSTY